MGDLDLGEAARTAGEQPALIDGEGRVSTWQDLADVARRGVAYLDAHARREGLAPSDPIGFVAPATPALFGLVHAAIASGRPFVPLHPRLTSTEVEVVAKALGPMSRIDPAPAEGASPVDLPSPPPDEDRPLAILASSGTSGVPKGVVLSRRAFAAAARASAARIPLGSGDRWLACMPMAHAGGLSILTRALAARATVVLQPRFDAGRVLRAIREHGVTHLSVVPTMLADLLAHPEAAELARLRALLVGGAACPDARLAEARALGCPALATYGLTEGCSQITTQPPGDRHRAPDGDCGLPLPGIEVAIRAGEIFFRSAAQMTGYRGAPPIAAEGWIATGDLGELRADGRLVVHARRTDLVVTGGENVYPAEVEAVLRAGEGVRDVVVVGVEDDRWGQIVAAIVVLAEGTTAEQVFARAASQLAPHKRPRRVVDVEGPLPRTSKGDLDRAAAKVTWGERLAHPPAAGLADR